MIEFRRKNPVRLHSLRGVFFFFAFLFLGGRVVGSKALVFLLPLSCIFGSEYRGHYLPPKQAFLTSWKSE